MVSGSYRWNFPSNNYGQIVGISDSGVETFRGTPFKSLAREVCQNSLDARVNNGQPAKVVFTVFDIAPSSIPDYKRLEDALQRSMDFWENQESDKARSFFRNALTLIRKEKIRCLRISDYNTTGLVGSREEYNSPWCNLTKSTGTSDKSGTQGGSFGIGKYAPFACSAFRTVFYSTLDIEAIEAFQGVSRLTSFKNERNEITQGVGFYGDERNSPVYEQIFLDVEHVRGADEFGTDIYILGFDGGDDWQHQMVASILDGFLYAIFSNVLEVDVDGTIISRNTLASLIGSHKCYFQEYADEYYQALVDDKLARTFEKHLADDPETSGKLTLRLIIMPGFHRRVAMVRQTGMKIKDKGNISGLIPFAGVLLAEGDAINAYLRGLENPQHREWEIERASNKTKARNLMRILLRFIKESLDSMKDDDSEEAIDPSVGEYLSAIQEENPGHETTETISDSIRDVRIRIQAPRSEGAQGSPGSLLKEDKYGEIVASDLPGIGGSGGKNPGKGGGDGGGQNPGNGSGDTPIDHRKSMYPIAPISSRCFLRDKFRGEYTIVFTPSVSTTKGVLSVLMSAESQNYDAKILAASSSSSPNLLISGNKISNIAFVANRPTRIDLRIDYS